MKGIRLNSRSYLASFLAAGIVFSTVQAVSDTPGSNSPFGRRRRLAPTCTGSPIDSNRIRTISSDDARVYSLIGQELAIDDDDDAGNSDPIASALDTFLVSDDPSDQQQQRRYVRHGPTRTIWNSDKTAGVACFQRYHEYLGDAAIVGSELVVRTDCGTVKSTRSTRKPSSAVSLFSSDANTAADGARNLAPGGTASQLFRKRRHKNFFKSVVSKIRSFSSANIPGIARTNTEANMVRIVSISGKVVPDIISKTGTIPSHTHKEAVQALATALDVDYESALGMSTELKLAPTVHGDKLVYVASNGMSTNVMLDAHTLDLVLLCRGEEQIGGYGSNNMVGRKLEEIETVDKHMNQETRSSLRRRLAVTTWNQANCTMNTLYLDNDNLQAECQTGTDDTTQQVEYRLGPVSSLNYYGTYEYGPSTYFSYLLASAPGGVVGTNASSGSAVADVHYAAIETLKYIRSVLDIEGVGVNQNNAVVPMYALVDYYYCGVPEWAISGQLSYIRLYVCEDSNPLVSIDVVAHEIMHGVSYYSSRLSIGSTTNEPKPESFGLLEGFCDILGAVMEFYIDNSGDDPDFKVGEEANSAAIIRYMEDPDPNQDHIDSVCDSWGQTGFKTFGPLTKAYVESVRSLESNTSSSLRDAALAMGEVFLKSNILLLGEFSEFTDAAIATYEIAANITNMPLVSDSNNAFTSSQLTSAMVQGWSTVDLILTVLGDSKSATRNCNSCFLTLNFRTDTTPGANSWDLINSTGDKIQGSGTFPHAGTEFNTTFCIPPGKYTFILSDSYGNGLLNSTFGDNSGFFKWLGGDTLLATGDNDFGNYSTTEIDIISNGACINVDGNGTICSCIDGYLYENLTCSDISTLGEFSPSTQPSAGPSAVPSQQPSSSPSVSNKPTEAEPATMPPTESQSPSDFRSEGPTLSSQPSLQPSNMPTLSAEPSSVPSVSPSLSAEPSSVPSVLPSLSSEPSSQPSNVPTLSAEPSSAPSGSPSESPIAPPTVGPATPAGAKYHAGFKSPACLDEGGPISSCDSGTLLVGVAGSETDSPNTINDSCEDGTSGEYQTDESIDKLMVSTLDGTSLAPGKPAEIEARVFAYSSFTGDSADFYYADPSQCISNNPTWTLIDTVVPSKAGFQDLRIQYILPIIEGLHCIRVNFRWQGSASPCSGGSYDDADDLVFYVASEPTASPTSSPSSKPSLEPSSNPSSRPSIQPSSGPSSSPSSLSSSMPSSSPSQSPSLSISPSQVPSVTWSGAPSSNPTQVPSVTSSEAPTSVPSVTSSEFPSQSPSGTKSEEPSQAPSVTSSNEPSSLPSLQPSGSPSSKPSEGPSKSSESPTPPIPSGKPSAPPTVAPPKPADAVYDEEFKVPSCRGEARPITSCDSGIFLEKVALSEPNQPNTIDSCTDGTSGTYQVDESIDRLVISSVDGISLAPGKPAEIEARVFAYSSFTGDSADFYYADPSQCISNNPAWTLIGTVVPSKAGFQDLRIQYILPTVEGLHCIRVNFRWQGSESPCSGGRWDDTDDLVFIVASEPIAEGLRI